MMNKTMKKTVATFCMGAAVLTLTPAVSMAETAVVPVNQQQSSEIAPYMAYIQDAVIDLIVVGTKGTVDCSVSGDYENATKAKVIAELQVKSGSSWIPVKIWTETQESYEAYVYESHTLTFGNTYRVKATMTIWEGSLSETKTFYSDEQTA